MHNLILPGTGTHCVKGSPWWAGLQVQVAIWLTTWQRACIPQVPGQGSRHDKLAHALLAGQSELATHSGRQPEYGSPKYPGLQAHCSRRSRVGEQIALGPQGEGWQGVGGVGGGGGGARLHCWNGSPV